MRNFWKTAAVAAALVGVSSPASAQNLTWLGTGACWKNALSNPANNFTISPSNCSTSSNTSTSITWDNNDSNDNKSRIDFTITEYNNSNSNNTNDWPGGPASNPGNSGTDRPVAFGGTGDSFARSLYLGYFNYDDQRGSSLLSATLGLNLFFTGASFNYDLFGVTYGEDAGAQQSCGWKRVNNQWREVCETVNYDILTLNSAGWQDFNVGGQSYSFRVAGFDQPYPNSSKDYCSEYDALPEVLPEGGSGGATDGKLCGQVRWNGAVSSVPEPSTYVLMASGLLGLGVVARRRRNNAA